MQITNSKYQIKNILIKENINKTPDQVFPTSNIEPYSVLYNPVVRPVTQEEKEAAIAKAAQKLNEDLTGKNQTEGSGK